MFNSLPSSENLVSSAKLTYSRNGFAILDLENEIPLGIDFFVESTSREKISVKCIFLPEHELISEEYLRRLRDKVSKRIGVHIVTTGRFSKPAVDFAKSKKIGLIDGSRVQWRLGTFTVEAGKEANCLSGPSMQSKAKSMGKTTIGIIGRVALVAAVGLIIYGVDKAEWVDGKLRFGGPGESELQASDFHFVEDHDGETPVTVARKDAVALARHLKREKKSGVDFLMIAGNDIETAVRLFAERFRVSTSEEYPEYRENFDAICDPDSERLERAVVYLSIEDSAIVYEKDPSRLQKVAKITRDRF